MGILTMIRSITAADTYPLRHRVLWPDKPFAFVKVPEDESGLHFGYFVEEQLVSVISLFVNAQGIARFRKFATHPDFQRKGLGSALLKIVFERALELRATAIWCDARLEAKPFYERFGMVQEGELFYKGEIAYVKMTRVF
ncbi:GCN5-related N-acetyltransferase [Runella slithyformis DSM 19594]|uniref:GCN5-related N-acetyltransferase n=2 Tax=Runella TaxID=105 RepID=A0A7U3ZLA6_RUNSL|nr:GCN5-related N-acetyltransferase [Runella slithyformis DSM 19594]